MVTDDAGRDWSESVNKAARPVSDCVLRTWEFLQRLLDCFVCGSILECMGLHKLVLKEFELI